MKSIKYQEAFFVQSWGDEIIKGVAFNLKFKDWYEKEQSFFIKDGETMPSMVETSRVVYDIYLANALLNKEKNSKKEYYEKQIREANQKLKELA